MSVGVIIDEDHQASVTRASGRLEVQTFGAFRIIDSRTKRDIHFRSRKALALLCYFAVATDHALMRSRANVRWNCSGARSTICVAVSSDLDPVRAADRP